MVSSVCDLNLGNDKMFRTNLRKAAGIKISVARSIVLSGQARPEHNRT